VVDAIPDFALRPYVSGRSLHVGSVMIAYIAGPLLFGWPGIFLGPMLLVVVFQFVHIVLPELVARGPIQPDALDPDALGGGGPTRAGEPSTPGEAGGTEPGEGPDSQPSGSRDESRTESNDG
ncbi:MAG: AI-2E family transporter, partial [Haloarculaceae archaeon]